MIEEKKDSIVRFSSEKIELPCEWLDCNVVESVMPCFIRHISEEHLPSLTEEDLECKWRDCEGTIHSLAELHRHILYHAFHTKIKCYGRNLARRKNLKDCTLGPQGRTIIPEIPESLTCIWSDCQEIFQNPEFFYRHLDMHAESSPKSKPICFWIDCNKELGDNFKLRDHLRSHSQEKVIACPTCGGMFASRTKFLEHIDRQALVLDYACEVCSRKLPTKKLLRDHVRIHVNHYKCPYCDMSCPTPSSLSTHMMYRHSDVKMHACHFCDYKCKRPNDLQKHLDTHSSVPSLVCPHDNCDFSCKSRSSYKKHIQTVHQALKPAPYACHICSKVLTRGNYLSKHLMDKHNFCWPAGHCRFRYHKDSNGIYRIQTARLESSELSETIIYESSELRMENDQISILQASDTGNGEKTSLAQNIDAIIAEALKDAEFLDLDSPSVDEPMDM